MRRQKNCIKLVATPRAGRVRWYQCTSPPDAQRVQRLPDRPRGSSHAAVGTYGFRSARNVCSRLHFVQTNTSLRFPKVRSAGLVSLSRRSPPHTQRNEGGGSTRGRMWFRVRRQSFWDSERDQLREALACLVSDVKRLAYDAASVGLRWSVV
jgi:hypothetical protein